VPQEISSKTTPWCTEEDRLKFLVLLLFHKQPIRQAFGIVVLICFKISTLEQYAVRAFADALDVIPLALAENR
jgi:hypothetical protein